MFFKSVTLNVLCFKNPCDLKILSCDGRLIEKLKTRSISSKICFCIRGQFIRLKATYKNHTEYKTIYLCEKRCQDIFVNFAFNTSISQRVFNVITLTDATYGFPVKNALLSFRQTAFDF